jgi:hypothetical protein
MGLPRIWVWINRMGDEAVTEMPVGASVAVPLARLVQGAGLARFGITVRNYGFYTARLIVRACSRPSVGPGRSSVAAGGSGSGGLVSLNGTTIKL